MNAGNQNDFDNYASKKGTEIRSSVKDSLKDKSRSAFERQKEKLREQKRDGEISEDQYFKEDAQLKRQKDRRIDSF